MGVEEVERTKPEEGEEQKHLASVERTSYFTDKLVVPSDSCRNLATSIG